MVCSFPQLVPLPLMVTWYGILFEHQIRYPTHVGDRLQVGTTQVGFVCRHLTNSKMVGGRPHKWDQVRRITGIGSGDLNSGDDISRYATHNVSFNPLRILHHPAPLVVIPSVIHRRRKTGGIHCEIPFYRPQRKGALLNERLQNGRQSWVFQVPGCAGKGRYLVKASLGLRIQPRPFGAVRDFIGSRSEYQPGRDPSTDWQTLLRWFKFFLPWRFEVSVPNHSEITIRLG